MKAIVLAGGNGKRMFPFSDHHQKCCLPIANRANIARVIDQIQAEGISDITVLGSEPIQDVICELEGYAVTILSVAPVAMQQRLAELADTDTLVMYGDIVVAQAAVHDVLMQFAEHGTTVLVQPRNSEWRTQDMICADVQNGMVQAIYGHPRGTYANTRMMGVYVLSASDCAAIRYTRLGFDHINCGQMPDHAYHVENTIQKRIEQGVSVRACVVETGFDLDFPWDLFAANRWMCSQLAGSLTKTEIAEGASISTNAILRGYVKVGRGSRIGDGVIIKGNCIVEENVIIEDNVIIYPNCIIGKGSVLRDGCKINANTVVGPYNKIGFGAELAGVTMMGVAQVHTSEVYGIVGRYVDIAAGVITGILKFDDMPVSQKIGMKRYQTADTNIVCIGDYTRTGVCNVMYPGVKIGSHCALGPNLIVDRDIAANQIAMPKQETEARPWGPEKYGW